MTITRNSHGLKVVQLDNQLPVDVALVLWRLAMERGISPGVDFDEDYEVPVSVLEESLEARGLMFLCGVRFSVD